MLSPIDLIKDGAKLSDKDINEHIFQEYSNLFNTSETLADNTLVRETLENLPKLSDEQKEIMDCDISLNELETVLFTKNQQR